MDIIIDDSSVVKAIHEYLISRRLFVSADALGKESGIQFTSSFDGDLLMPLKVFAVNGEWDKAKHYLQELFEILDKATQKRILFLFFRQRFCESCFSDEDVSVERALKDIVVEVQSCCSDAECEAMTESIHHYYAKQVNQHTFDTVVLATRLECYHEIAQLIDPILSMARRQQPSLYLNNERLISAIAKGQLYDRCVDYCHRRATSNVSERSDSRCEITCDEFLNSTSAANTDNLILQRLQSVPEDFLFKQPIDKTKLEVKVSSVPLKRHGIIPSPSVSPEKSESSMQQETLEQTIETKPHVSQAWDEATDKPSTNASQQLSQLHQFQHNDSTSMTQNQPPSNAVNVQSPATQPQSQDSNVEHLPDPRDSYADFMAEQAAVRQDRDRVLRQLQQKEEQANIIRQNLQVKQEPVFMEDPQPLMTTNYHQFPLEYVPVEKTEEGSAIRAVAFHPFGHVYAVGSNAQNLKICSMPKQPFNPSLHKQKYQAELGIGLEWTRLLMKRTHVHKGSIYALAWSGDGSMLASCSNDKMIKLFDFSVDSNHLSEPTFELCHHEGVVRDITFVDGFGSGSVLASCGSGNCQVFTYDCQVDTMLHRLTGHVDQILSLYSWNNGMLASTSQDKSLRIWDLKSARCASVLGFGPSSSAPVIPTSVCVDASGRYLVVGRDDNTISVYDLVAGKIAKDFQSHNGEIRSVRFNPVTPNLLLSGSYDGTALVTNIDAVLKQDVVELDSSSFRCHHHNDKIIQCRWHPSGQSFASTSADHSCVLWSQQCGNHM
uniref:WD repeat-containing protein 47-like n=1 Tax=Phallusia mammillata TaxID=59560 RepID=A0A6F9DXE2_9ASCI|nr:WD repeat-containing protein 47-like [Phallusia mammillata]